MTTEEKVKEWEAIKGMIKELEATKKLLESDLKEVAKKGPITLADGRTLYETIVSYERVDPDAVRSAGLFDRFKKKVAYPKLNVK